MKWELFPGFYFDVLFQRPSVCVVQCHTIPSGKVESVLAHVGEGTAAWLPWVVPWAPSLLV